MNFKILRENKIIFKKFKGDKKLDDKNNTYKLDYVGIGNPILADITENLEAIMDTDLINIFKDYQTRGLSKS